MKHLLILAMGALLLAGCAADPSESEPSEASQHLGSDADFMQMACIDFTTQDKAKIEADLKQYQDWTKIYEVDDVTLNSDTPQGIVCFEKPTE
ncbi:hypothetical protein [Shewanella surugensis]|uniref:Lipoprotein n=1 Tax=Shewanella surugensis TaxID=212020 RepID=A0ABT0LA96_9GAMM|nr:hypothetical protein [Shewanella surugensis]MCL1124639.1 hypothetical protein [Shewanella surugensis]